MVARDADRALEHEERGLRRAALRPLRDRRVARVERLGKEGWRAWFESQAIEPLVVTYERLLDDSQAEVERVAAAARIGLPAGIALRPYPGWRRQADSLNEEWIRQSGTSPTVRDCHFRTVNFPFGAAYNAYV